MLLIYSGDVPDLDAILVDELNAVNGSMLILPVSPGECKDAKILANCFRGIGVKALSLSQAAYSSPNSLAKNLMSSNAVYLMGGNTFDFLQFARSVNLFQILTQFEANGGIIAAESAGSILLSDSIATARLPSYDADENRAGMIDLQGMGRISFHISPHFEQHTYIAEGGLRELQSLANVSNQDVILLEDGEGFVMQGDRISQFIGEMKVLSPRQSSQFELDDVLSINPSLSTA